MAGRRKRRRDDEPSYWLSYSDMMAGLLLMFVIIISFTMMQAKTKFEADEKELKAQQETLARQQAQLEDQNTTMSEQSTTLTEQESQLAAQKAALEKQREELAAQQKKLKEQQDQLAAAQATMDSQESALSDAETTLTQQSSELTEKEKELAEAQAALKKQQTTLENQQKKLAGAESKISSQQQQMEDLVGVRKELIEQLKKAFEGTANVTVDSDGSIVFESSVLFDFNDAKLSDDGKTFLKQFLPMLSLQGLHLPNPSYENFHFEWLRNVKVSPRLIALQFALLTGPGCEQQHTNVRSLLIAFQFPAHLEAIHHRHHHVAHHHIHLLSLCYIQSILTVHSLQNIELGRQFVGHKLTELVVVIHHEYTEAVVFLLLLLLTLPTRILEFTILHLGFFHTMYILVLTRQHHRKDSPIADFAVHLHRASM